VNISEIFYSLQGEGELIGVPSVFVRTSGCNLRCTWCDTPYTSWQPEVNEVPLSEIVDAVKRHPASHVIVTGGEPMIAPSIVELTTLLREAGLHITIETAGTLYAAVCCDLMSISPKLSNSIPYDREGGRWAAQHKRLRLQPDVLRRLLENYHSQVKFVVSHPDDMPEIFAIKDALSIPASTVVLMPEGTTRDTVRERGVWLAEICKDHGFRYSTRLHVELWGDRRGV
jgi:7-carboxy-7-deazaguanine synthase